MHYVSTRGGIAPTPFQQSVMMGLADDGGLVIPERIPDVRDRLDSWRKLGYRELAFEVIRLFATDVPEADLRALLERAYGGQFEPEVAPTVKVGPVFVTELWHGPTLAFKDVALQLLGNLFEYILARTGGELNILGATSGDTGSAAIHGVRGRKGVRIFMMHPHGGTSAVQERQMTTVLDPNVHNVAVKGSFDDCQRIMKTVASDLEFKRRYSLGAVNSVNWARVLAQVVYYFKAVFDVQARTGAQSVRVSVPTGNFGAVLAGWYARQMGLPISQLILATNRNDILSRFFNTGLYSLGTVFKTLSPSMDIQVASNFERYLFHRVGCDSARLKGLMEGFARTGELRVEPDQEGRVDRVFAAGSSDEEQTLDTIRRYHRDHGYVLDPHTAVGVFVAEQQRGEEPVVCLSTAHPAKFPEAIEKATGNGGLARHSRIDGLEGLPTRCETLPNDEAAVRRFIEKHA